MRLDLDGHPCLVPPGYRIVYRWFWRPVLVAGRYRWLEHVRIVQRLMPCHFGLFKADWSDVRSWSDHSLGCNWADVGFFDEVMPTLTKPAPMENDCDI